LKDIERNGYTGIGKPEALSGNLAGFWSREIDEKNRLVYRLIDVKIEVAQCKGHYDDK
jgi:toxin YoeB